ncbi:hypothetical protein [Carp edema virus]|nr:hypothetical protein [Carp edema virus]
MDFLKKFKIENPILDKLKKFERTIIDENFYKISKIILKDVDFLASIVFEDKPSLMRTNLMIVDRKNIIYKKYIRPLFTTQEDLDVDNEELFRYMIKASNFKSDGNSLKNEMENAWYKDLIVYNNFNSIEKFFKKGNIYADVNEIEIVQNYYFEQLTKLIDPDIDNYFIKIKKSKYYNIDIVNIETFDEVEKIEYDDDILKQLFMNKSKKEIKDLLGLQNINEINQVKDYVVNTNLCRPSQILDKKSYLSETIKSHQLNNTLSRSLIERIDSIDQISSIPATPTTANATSISEKNLEASLIDFEENEKECKKASDCVVSDCNLDPEDIKKYENESIEVNVSVKSISKFSNKMSELRDSRKDSGSKYTDSDMNELLSLIDINTELSDNVFDPPKQDLLNKSLERNLLEFRNSSIIQKNTGSEVPKLELKTIDPINKSIVDIDKVADNKIESVDKILNKTFIVETKEQTIDKEENIVVPDLPEIAEDEDAFEEDLKLYDEIKFQDGTLLPIILLNTDLVCYLALAKILNKTAFIHKILNIYVDWFKTKLYVIENYYRIITSDFQFNNYIGYINILNRKYSNDVNFFRFVIINSNPRLHCFLINMVLQYCNVPTFFKTLVKHNDPFMILTQIIQEYQDTFQFLYFKNISMFNLKDYINIIYYNILKKILTKQNFKVTNLGQEIEKLINKELLRLRIDINPEVLKIKLATELYELEELDSFNTKNIHKLNKEINYKLISAKYYKT